MLGQLEQIRYLSMILDMILMNHRIWTIPIVHTQYINIDISRDVLLSPEAQYGKNRFFEFCHPYGAMCIGIDHLFKINIGV